MLQKRTYETVGPILLRRSQEDSSKIQKYLRCPAETVVEPKLWQKLPNKKLLKFVKKKVILGCYKNQHMKLWVVYFLIDRKRTPQKQ